MGCTGHCHLGGIEERTTRGGVRCGGVGGERCGAVATRCGKVLRHGRCGMALRHGVTLRFDRLGSDLAR